MSERCESATNLEDKLLVNRRNAESNNKTRRFFTASDPFKEINGHVLVFVKIRNIDTNDDKPTIFLSLPCGYCL